MKTILIVSHDQDKHAITILEKLKNRGEDVILLDYAKYPNEWQADISIQKKQTVITRLRIKTILLGNNNFLRIFPIQNSRMLPEDCKSDGKLLGIKSAQSSSIRTSEEIRVKQNYAFF